MDVDDTIWTQYVYTGMVGDHTLKSSYPFPEDGDFTEGFYDRLLITGNYSLPQKVMTCSFIPNCSFMWNLYCVHFIGGRHHVHVVSSGKGSTPARTTTGSV